jgi:hypothetical protein
MLTFLFWNLGNSPRLTALGRLARAHDVDVVVMAECGLTPGDVLGELNSGGVSSYHHSPSECDRVTIYSRFPHRFIKPVHESDRVSIRHLRRAGAQDLLLAAVHLRSKLHQTDIASNQLLATLHLAQDIAKVERKVGHQRSLVVGDLNMNPFDPAVVAGECLNATMDRRIAAKKERTINKKTYPFFYNPMWSLLGDHSAGPPGTYYYKSESGQVVYYWHMLDQVLLRPDLLPVFDNRSLQILDSDGQDSFLSPNGTPDTVTGSDHFPITFRLNC